MARDLRKLFAAQREKEKPLMKQGHEERFLARLEEQLPQEKKPSFSILKIAATFLLLCGLGVLVYLNLDYTADEPQLVKEDTKEEEQKGISLGDLSPDLKKLETYYVANINLELSKLEISNENKALIDSFMKQLDMLNSEYINLNDELNEIGPNDQTISALIQNLQLRLQLLQKLKKKLNELKTSKNEQVKTNIM
ncbi:hypothetical protein [Maribacter sp. 2307UL18-2]|uniref:hypothetical protein n=1 Tax=Maribacter sp. 2307UL18-2 TaxID=3386274 RepID=UPI0039BCD885